MSFKVLLVDHDTVAVERLGDVLEQAGHRLFAEADTVKALEALDRIRPDVALVADGLPGMPGAALCMRLKKTPRGSSLPVVFMTAKVPQGEEELSRRLELLGCDRIIDRETSSEQLLEICQQVVKTQADGNTAAPSPRGQVITQELPKVSKNANRDASSAESSGEATRSAFTDGSRPADGLDIEAHLDSVFSMGLPGDEPASFPEAAPAEGATIQMPVVPAAPQQHEPTAPAKPPRAQAPKPVPAPKKPVARQAQAQPAASPQPAKTTPEAPKPAPVQPRAKTRPKPADEPQPVARQAPKAVEQLRLPRVPEISSDKASGARRWMWPVVGLVAVTVVLGSLAVAYLVFLRGNDTAEPQQVAQASAQTVTPAPIVAELVEAEPLPRPPPLDEPTSSIGTPAPAVEKPASVPPQSKPRVESPRAQAEDPPRPIETAPKSEPAATSVAEASPEPTPAPRKPAEPVAAPVAAPVATSEATKVTQPESTPTPQPQAETPIEQATPPRAAVPEEAEPKRSEPGPTAAVVATEPVVVPPEVLERVEPTYSAKAVKGIDNPVIALRVLVDQQGKIARVLVDEGIPGSELEGAAISAVLRWRFRPATEDGVPVKAWTTVRFVFED